MMNKLDQIGREREKINLLHFECLERHRNRTDRRKVEW